MKKKIIIIVSICLAVCIGVGALIFALTRPDPPEYWEIKDRFEYLVLESAYVNEIFFGKGLPTYERVTDPYSSTKTYHKTTLDAEGNEIVTRYYYYELNDDFYGQIIGYRSSYLDDFTYLKITDKKIEGEESVYADEVKGIYGYELYDYIPPEYEFFYDDTDPQNYDYVRFDLKFDEEEEEYIRNISDIKKIAERVYSSDYLSSIYSSMFDGVSAAAGNVSALKARYIEYSDGEDPTPYLMMNNSSDYVFIEETRVFDFETAKIADGSNADYVYISVDTYLPSNPSDRLNITVSMIKENGVWMLDSATY